MSEWQPIETAPKDGTAIMLYDAKGNIGIGIMTTESYGDHTWIRGDAAWIGDWPMQDGIKRLWLGGTEPKDAVGWQPLPEPPKQ